MDAFSPLQTRDAAALSEALHRIHEAGTRPACWSSALAAIAGSFGCGRALLFTPLVSPQDGGLFVPCGIPEEALPLWQSSCVDAAIWAEQVSRQGHRSGDVMLDGGIAPQNELPHSAFHPGLFHQVVGGRSCAGIVSVNEPGVMATWLAVFRDLAAPPFNAGDSDWMRLLISHVARALHVMLLIDTERAKQAALLASFDRLHFGVVLLDSEMRVAHLNARAQMMLDRQDGLAISANGQLECTSGPERHGRLSQWLDRVRAAVPGRRTHLAYGCLVPRYGQTSHYVVQCTALAARSQWSIPGADFKYVAFITDPAALPFPGEERLMQLYGLTHTQSRVALAFAGGASYKEAARSLCMSEDTVRSHVKEIYPKTRVNRQADLVRLVLSLGPTGIPA